MMTNLDDEIRTVEERIARERNGLAALLDDCEETARDAVAAPKTLAAVTALGFVLGEATSPRRPAAGSRKRGIAGLLAGAALGLIRARYGSPWMLAQRILMETPPRPERAARRPPG